jgi:hypothetical protein
MKRGIIVGQKKIKSLSGVSGQTGKRTMCYVE